MNQVKAMIDRKSMICIEVREIKGDLIIIINNLMIYSIIFNN